MAAKTARDIIDSTRRRLLGRKLAAMLSLFLGCVCLLALAACWFDWRYSLGTTTRLAIWLFGLLLMGTMAVLVIIAFSRRPPKREAARIREVIEPFWKGRLIALAESDEGRLEIAAGLKDMLEEQAEETAAAAGPRKHPEKIVAGAHRICAAVMVILIGLAAWYLPIGRVLGRVLIPWANIQPARRLSLSVSPGDAEVERGHPLSITARVTGGEPKEVEIVMEREPEPERALEADLDDEGIYNLYIPAVNRSFSYHARADNARSPLYRITAITYPRLKEIVARIELPEYTGGETETRRGGPISLLEGSAVRLVGRATTELSEAGITVTDDDGNELVSRKTEAHGTEFAFSLVPESDGEYEISLLSAQGRANKDAYRYPIRVKPDEPPSAEILWPSQDSKEIPTAFIPVSWEGTDDWGVGKARFILRSPKEEIAPREISYDKATIKKVAGEFILSLTELELSPGDVVALQVEAVDNLQQSARSAPRFVQVIPFEEELHLPTGAEEFAGELQKIYIPFKALTEKQRKVTGRIMESEGKKDPDTPYLVSIQEAARQQLDDVLGKLNRQFPGGIPHKLYDIVTGLDEVRRHMDSALDELDKTDLPEASGQALKALNKLCEMQTKMEWWINAAANATSDLSMDESKRDPFPDRIPPEELAKLEQRPREALSDLVEELEEQSRDLQEGGGQMKERIEKWLREEKMRGAGARELLEEVLEKANAMSGEQFSYMKDSMSQKSGKEAFYEMGFSEGAADKLSRDSGAQEGKDLAGALNEIRKLEPDKRNRLEYDLGEKGGAALESVEEDLSRKTLKTLKDMLFGQSPAGELLEETQGMSVEQFEDLSRALREGAERGKFSEMGFSEETAEVLEEVSGGVTGEQLAQSLEEFRGTGKGQQEQLLSDLEEKGPGALDEASSPLSPDTSESLQELARNNREELSRLARFTDTEVADMVSLRIDGREAEQQLGAREAEALRNITEGFNLYWRGKIKRLINRRDQIQRELGRIEEAKLSPGETAALRDLRTTLLGQQSQLTTYYAGPLGLFDQWVLPGEALLWDSLRQMKAKLRPMKTTREDLEEIAGRLKLHPVPERFKNLVYLYYRYILERGKDATP